MWVPMIGRDPEKTSDPVVVAKVKNVARKYGFEVEIISEVNDFRPPELQNTDEMCIGWALAVGGSVMLTKSHRNEPVQKFLASPKKVDAWMKDLAEREKPYQDGTLSAGPLWLGYGKDGMEFVGQTGPAS
jgi:hypothetical protein